MSNLEQLGRSLQEARKWVRLSQTTVGQRLGVTRQVVSAYESGKRDISAIELYTLCNLFRLTPNELLGVLVSAEPEGAVSLNFRMNNDYKLLTDHDRREIDAMVGRTRDAEATFLQWQSAFEKYNRIARSSFQIIRLLTEKVRSDFEQNEPPINIYLIIDGLGVSLVPTAFDKVAAVVGRAESSLQRAPWIAVNSSQPSFRQRFSIAHELAHLLLHEEELVLHAHYFKKQFEKKEIDADSFASELLLPRELLKASIESVAAQTIEEAVLLLSHLYQVSFAAMAYRLYALEMITRSKYEELGKIKPTKLAEAIGRKVPTRPFDANALLTPLVQQQLKLTSNPRAFTQDVVRKIQEMAYTRYLGSETRGGADLQTVYDLESAGTVYEKVALWVADNYPLFASIPQNA
ncbi:MAG TPA: XRE family transcriptional regulator [Pyrinomonadaceae bacterium]|nr:XRE family transcriptional regulator [Pyrinomonadaceae bacterium]